MQKLPTQPGSIIEWLKLKKTPTAEFELKNDSGKFAHIRWEKKCGSLASGETAYGKWSFKRIGFFATKIAIRQHGSELDFAEFIPNWKRDGIIKFTDGRTYLLKSKSFWKANYIITDLNGLTYLSFAADNSIALTSAKLTIGPNLLDPTILSLLVLLSLYVGVLAIDDASNTAIMAAIIS